MREQSIAGLLSPRVKEASSTWESLGCSLHCKYSTCVCMVVINCTSCTESLGSLAKHVMQVCNGPIRNLPYIWPYSRFLNFLFFPICFGYNRFVV